MSDVFSSVGTLIAVSATLPATQDAAGFAALTYSLIGEVSEVPEKGAEDALVTHTPLATGVVEKRTGSRDNGEMTLPFALSASDLGADILKTINARSAGMDKRAAFKETLPDGSILYYIGLVRSFMRNIGNADAIAGGSTIVSLTSNIIEVPAP